MVLLHYTEFVCYNDYNQTDGIIFHLSINSLDSEKSEECKWCIPV